MLEGSTAPTPSIPLHTSTTSLCCPVPWHPPISQCSLEAFLSACLYSYLQQKLAKHLFSFTCLSHHTPNVYRSVLRGGCSLLGVGEGNDGVQVASRTGTVTLTMRRLITLQRRYQLKVVQIPQVALVVSTRSQNIFLLHKITKREEKKRRKKRKKDK